MMQPAPEAHGNGPRDVFFYTLSFVALYISVIGTIILAWGLADYLFEDRPGYGSSDAVRGAISMVVIAFPIFMYLTYLIRKKLASGDMAAGSMLAKVLTYITLFAVAITAIIDLIVVLYNFLGGDLTAQFAVKSLSLLVIVTLVFGYFRSELKEQKAGAADDQADLGTPEA